MKAKAWDKVRRVWGAKASALLKVKDLRLFENQTSAHKRRHQPNSIHKRQLTI